MATWKYKITNTVPWTHGAVPGNADNIYALLNAYGFTLEAAVGVIANMDAESYLNPGQKELGTTSPAYGWGLIQWTPSTAITSLITPWYSGNKQVGIVVAEMTGAISGRWIPTSAYPYSGAEFAALTDIYEATKAYFYERERGTWSDARLTYAGYWYNYLSGKPIPPIPSGEGYIYGGIRDVLRRLIIHA